MNRDASTISHYATPADAKTGYEATHAALLECSTTSIAREYLSSMRDCFGFFGNNAATWTNLLGAELIRRGVDQIPNIFGAIPVVTTHRGPASR